jgi:spore cortex protein
MDIGNDTPRFSRTDRNYHESLNGIDHVGNPSYYNIYDGKLADRLVKRAEQVDGVRNARALVNGDDVIVAVNPENNADTSDLKREVKRAVKPLVENKELRISTKEGVYNTVQSVDNDLRDGEWHLRDLDDTMRGLTRTMD